MITTITIGSDTAVFLRNKVSEEEGHNIEIIIIFKLKTLEKSFQK